MISANSIYIFTFSSISVDSCTLRSCPFSLYPLLIHSLLTVKVSSLDPLTKFPLGLLSSCLQYFFKADKILLIIWLVKLNILGFTVLQVMGVLPQFS